MRSRVERVYKRVLDTLFHFSFFQHGTCKVGSPLDLAVETQISFVPNSEEG
jgi:hypothetical protein